LEAKKDRAAGARVREEFIELKELDRETRRMEYEADMMQLLADKRAEVLARQRKLQNKLETLKKRKAAPSTKAPATKRTALDIPVPPRVPPVTVRAPEPSTVPFAAELANFRFHDAQAPESSSESEDPEIVQAEEELKALNDEPSTVVVENPFDPFYDGVPLQIEEEADSSMDIDVDQLYLDMIEHEPPQTWKHNRLRRIEESNNF